MTKSGLANMTKGLNTGADKDSPARTEGARLPEVFTDVLYLTNQPVMPAEVKRLLKRKGLSFLVLPIDDFPKVLHCLGLIGTVIVDAKGLDVSQQQKLARIIESLEMGNVGAILLNHRVRLPVKSFSLSSAPVKSFSLASMAESVSLDELWVRISVNLAYRRKGSEFFVRPASPPMQMESSHNKLAEKLQITGGLVDELTEQLRMAGLVQRDFLPRRMPETERIKWANVFMPAEWVSGDIFDVARIDEQHVGFYVADAVGHAMPAALLTIFVKQALVMRETIGGDYRIFSPTEVMTTLNRRIAEQKLSGYQFATCCYCLLNIETLELTYSRAGHPYPVLIRPDEEPRQLESQGPLLGIFEQSEYEQQTVQLQSGDKLLVYSDGAEPFIGSFNNVTGFSFSDEFYRIKDLPVGEMMDNLNQLVGTQQLAPSEIDDTTAVALEVL